MERPPYPGSLGERIHLNISKEAWDLWLEHQTMLINEKQLSLVDPNVRKYLRAQMWRFFKNQEVDSIEGFKPES